MQKRFPDCLARFECRMEQSINLGLSICQLDFSREMFARIPRVMGENEVALDKTIITIFDEYACAI